jgi:8-oxo-dGTP diphosphatase
MADLIVVVAAVVEQDGCFLVTRRLKGTHLEGCWEFPGGKRDAGESDDECLARELREELDVDATVGPLVLTTTHRYADRTIELRFHACALHGTPRAMLGQAMRWAAREELGTLEFPPADAELIAMLRGRDQQDQE